MDKSSLQTHKYNKEKSPEAFKILNNLNDKIAINENIIRIIWLRHKRFVRDQIIQELIVVFSTGQVFWFV